MVFITGDTHGEFSRLRLLETAAGRQLTKEDFLIISGDFGGIWRGDRHEQSVLDELAAQPFTILFADGNHENYDLLDSYPTDTWHGGRVQYIRDNLIHLMRGQIYEIEGKTFFVLGGAACHDIHDGVLDKDDPELEKKFTAMQLERKMFRVRGISWWAQELPDESELNEAWENLKAHDMKVDYIITHCAPSSIQQRIRFRTFNFSYKDNALTDFLEKVYSECSYREWYCGHYHFETEFENFFVKYGKIKRLI